LVIIGAFLYSLNLELLLANLEKSNIERKSIMVVPMDMDPVNPSWLEDKKKHLRDKGIEVGIACATGFSVIGASMGFILAWGPVIWGLITAGIGFGLGFCIFFKAKKLSRYQDRPHELPEIIVLVQCKDEQSEQIKDMMWKHSTLAVGTISI
jgi:hypothetical protein